MKYVKVDDLQAYCDNQIDHSITPNDFQRMNHREVVRCKDCVYGKMSIDDRPYRLPCRQNDQLPDWFCADGKVRE